MNLWRLARAQWDRTLGGALFLLGGLAIVLGWVGVAGEALTARQVPYIISGGIGGIFLLGLGAVFWLSADLRDEWRKLEAIEEAVLTRNAQTSTDAADSDDRLDGQPSPAHVTKNGLPTRRHPLEADR